MGILSGNPKNEPMHKYLAYGQHHVGKRHGILLRDLFESRGR